MIAADVDGDGHLDVIGAASDRVAWYRNDGSERFTAHIISQNLDRAQDVSAVDVDGDGDLDVLSTSYRENEIAWFENDGSGGFTTHTISTDAENLINLSAADLDGDGDVDLLSGSYFGHTVEWYENDGSGGFAARSVIGPVEGPTHGLPADVDGDGDIDLLSVSSLNYEIVWHENTAPIVADYPHPLMPLSPTGSLVYETAAPRRIETAGAVDTLEVELDAGQFVTIVIEPHEGLRAVVELRDSGGLVVGAASAAAPGESLELHNVPIVEAGTYTMTVNGLAGTTGRFAGRLLLNADFEAEPLGGAPNDDPASAQDIQPAMLPLGAGLAERGAVIGSSDGDDDWYRVALDDGESMSVVLNSLSGGSSSIELYDAANTRLTFDAGPVAQNGEFLDTTSDGVAADYFVRVFGSADEYNLVVTRGARLAVESAGATLDLSLDGTVLGHLDASVGVGSRDFTVGVTAGDMLEISTLTPADGPGEFVNLLDPRVELYDPSGALVAGNDNGAADGRNALLTHAADVSGQHSVRVVAVGETAGEFVLALSGASGALPGFQVISSDLADGATVSEPPARIALSFSSALRLDSINAADLSVGGLPATAVSVLDNATLRFDLPAIGDGVHEVAISSGALTSLSGTPVSSFAQQFEVDRSGPRVVQSSILQASVLPSGSFEYIARFDEALLAVSIDMGDVSLVGQTSGQHFPSGVVYDLATLSLVASFADLPDDAFTLTLRSGNGRIEDLLGNALDGERHPTTTVPSGNGVAGGDFVVDFLIDGGPPRVVESSLREGDLRGNGELTFTARFSEPIDPNSVLAAHVTLIGARFGVIETVSAAYNASTSTMIATFPELSSDQYTLSVLSGVDGLTDLTGNALDGERHPTTTVPSGDGTAGGDFEIHFTVDGTAPRVIASSILQNDLLATDTFVYTAQFDEPLLAGVLDASDMRLASQRNGVFAPTQFEYDDATSTLTLGFDDLPDDSYTLTLRSGSSRFRDVAGNLLDGERHPTTTVPSGNGASGGDFVVGFVVESSAPQVIDSSIIEGDVLTAGELIYTAQFDEPLERFSVVAANVQLVGSTDGDIAATSVTYSTATSTLTATFPSLSIDQYLLTLHSGAGGITDPSGKPLDGERHATDTVPSGDGTPGGDFEVHFSIPAELSGTFDADTVLPTGSGPWRVTGDLIVRAGVTFTIEPGVDVLFDPVVEMTVRGRIVAVGEPDSRIRLFGADGAFWDGIHIRDSTEDNVFAYVDIADAQSSSGSIGAFDSVLTIDNMTFAGSLRRYVRVVDASAVIRNSVFPDRFGPDESPTASDDNVVEMINGTGIMTGGQMIIEGNTFGTNKGHNDIIDFVSPVRPAPILQVLNNVFLGTGDEMLDLGGDAYIEGNVFMHARRDEFNTSSGQTNAISTGDGATDAVIVAVRNVFYDIEHIINLERNNFVILEHNTVVGIPEDAIDPGNGIFQEYSLVNFVIVNRSSAGRGAHLDGNVVFDVPRRIFGEPDTAQNGGPGPLSDIIVNNTLLPAERCSDAIGQRPGTIVDLGTNILCGDPLFVDPAGDFHLLRGSPAIGAGTHGLDLGAFVPAGASLPEWPTLTAQSFATFTIDGPGIIEYRFRLDGGPWSNAASVDEPIELTDLADSSHRIEVIGQNYAGVWQEEADTVERTWTVDSTIPHAVAENDDFATDEDTVLVVDVAGGVLANDDGVGSELSAELFSGPFHGTLTLHADGSLRYTPEGDFAGDDTFTYRANGDAVESDLATVTITVRPVNDPPVAADDIYAVPVGGTIRSDSGVILADNPSGYFRLDDEVGATQAVDSSGNAHHGTYVGDVQLQQPGATADTSNRAIALDRSADRISLPNVLMDGMADLTVEFWFNTSDPGTNVLVSGSGPGDRGFFDDNEYLLLFNNETRVGMSTGEDFDRSRRLEWSLPSIADGQWHHYIFVRNDGEDFLELFLDGASLGRRAANLTPITVAPGGLIIGEDQDVLGGGFDSSQSLNGLLDELAIFPRAFDAADAQRHFAGGQQRGLLDNDVDVDSDPLSIVLVDDVTSGSLELADDGSFTYTPLANFVGVDRFTYRVSDGEELSNVATVTIEVGSQDDATTVEDDAYTAAAGQTLTVATGRGVLANDVDPHGDALVAVLVDPPQHGELTLEDDGSFSFAPEAGFVGVDTFTYRASDGTSLSSVATATIDVGRSLPADLTGDGFVDFDDLTLQLARWNQNVSAALGNLVDPLTTPINFQDLTLLLAAWTGPGPVGAPQAAVGSGDDSAPRRDRRATDSVLDGERDEVVLLKHNLRSGRRAAARSHSAGGTYGGRQAGSLSYRRLQAVAVDRVMGEEELLAGRRDFSSLRRARRNRR